MGEQFWAATFQKTGKILVNVFVGDGISKIRGDFLIKRIEV